MTTRIVTDCYGRKHITNEPLLHPPQRKWVGLTDEEGHRIVNSCQTGTSREIFRAIEAKLKEKNHGH